MRVQDYNFFSLLGPNCPKLVFRPQTPNFSFWIKNVFQVKLNNILHKTSPYFERLDNFWQSYDPSKLKKKNIKNTIFGAIPDYVSPHKPCFFWDTKTEISPEQLD